MKRFLTQNQKQLDRNNKFDEKKGKNNSSINVNTTVISAAGLEELSIVESQNDQKDIETPGLSRKIPFKDRINESIAKD